jgi:tRNA1(Val) A37 N6-methylase TrmN6
LTADTDLSFDDFLGGQIRLWQPLKGYRAGVDAVLLAASISAKPGDKVLELGCGTGAVMACLGHRVKGVALTGIERNADYADLARRNLTENALSGQVLTGDFTTWRFGENAGFDHILANPPYFHAGTRATDPGRLGALHEETPLSLWVDTARKLLRPKGQLTMIHRADRLRDLLAAFGPQFGALHILPLVPRAGQPATLTLVRATRDSKAGTQLLSPMILHQGTHHTGDRNDYTPEARKIMWDGHALTW